MGFNQSVLVFFITIIVFGEAVQNKKSNSGCEFNLSWMTFISNNHCIHIAGNEIPICVYQEILRASFTAIVQNHNLLLNRSISALSRTVNCESFLFFNYKLAELHLIFQDFRIHKKRFFPFSKIFLVSTIEIHSFDLGISELRYIYNNALNVFHVNAHQIKNLLTKQELVLSTDNKQSWNQFIGHNLNHPFLDRDDRNKEFAVSFYNCSPHVIIFNNKEKKFVINLN